MPLNIISKIIITKRGGKKRKKRIFLRCCYLLRDQALGFPMSFSTQFFFLLSLRLFSEIVLMNDLYMSSYLE